MSEELTTWQRARHASDRLVRDCNAAREMDNEYVDPDEDETEREARRADLPNPDDVLSIDVETRARVLLTYGGPTVFVEYVFSGGDFIRAEYVTTDNASRDMVRVDLSDDDAETIADAYIGGIHMLADAAGVKQ